MIYHVLSNKTRPSSSLNFFSDFQDAEIQHLATSAWALARLHGNQQAHGASKIFLRSLAAAQQMMIERGHLWLKIFEGGPQDTRIGSFSSEMSILCRQIAIDDLHGGT